LADSQVTAAYEMAKGDAVVRSRERNGDENGSDYNSPYDDALMRLGKKPVLEVCKGSVHLGAVLTADSVTLASCPFSASAAPC
jgi:hypothetical protein